MMSVKSTASAVVLAAVCIINPASSEAAMPAQVSGSKIHVGDVVSKCLGAACEIEVGPAPLPGRAHVVRRQDVIKALREAGIDPKHLKIPMRRRVLRPARKASKQELAEHIRNAVIDILPDGVALESLGRISELDVPKNGYQVKARWPGERSFRRRVSVPIDLVADGALFRTLQISAILTLEIRLPVAIGDLPKGTILDNRVIKWTEAKLKAPPGKLACSASELIGRRLTQVVAKGEPFKVAVLEKIPVVTRGQRLTVESIQGLIRIRTYGEARQDGAVGDRIRIVVPSSSRLLWAEVTAPGLAVVLP